MMKKMRKKLCILEGKMLKKIRLNFVLFFAASIWILKKYIILFWNVGKFGVYVAYVFCEGRRSIL